MASQCLFVSLLSILTIILTTTGIKFVPVFISNFALFSGQYFKVKAIFHYENNFCDVEKTRGEYQKKATTPLDIVLIECAIEELKNKTKEELMSYFSTKAIVLPFVYCSLRQLTFAVHQTTPKLNDLKHSSFFCSAVGMGRISGLR